MIASRAIRALAVALFWFASIVIAQPVFAEFRQLNDYLYRCDSPSGRFEHVAIAARPYGQGLIVYVRYIGPSRGRGYAPAAGFAFDFGRAGIVEVHVTAVEQRLSVDLYPPRSRRSRRLGHFPLDREVTMMFAVGADSLQVTTETHSVQWPTGRAGLAAFRLTCQSGNFEFDFGPRHSSAPR